jgi:hypothetical protein
MHRLRSGKPKKSKLSNSTNVVIFASLALLLLIVNLVRATKDESGDFLETLGPELAPFLIAGVRLSYLSTTFSGIALILLAGLGRLILFEKRNR